MSNTPNKTKKHKKLLNSYFDVVDNIIYDHYTKKLNKFKYETTFFGLYNSKYIEYLEIAYKVRQLQMREGFIAEKILGSFPGWYNL